MLASFWFLGSLLTPEDGGSAFFRNIVELVLFVMRINRSVLLEEQPLFIMRTVRDIYMRPVGRMHFQYVQVRVNVKNHGLKSFAGFTVRATRKHQRDYSNVCGWAVWRLPEPWIPWDMEPRICVLTRPSSNSAVNQRCLWFEAHNGGDYETYWWTFVDF
jgi:hypothetical protein